MLREVTVQPHTVLIEWGQSGRGYIRLYSGYVYPEYRRRTQDFNPEALPQACNEVHEVPRLHNWIEIKCHIISEVIFQTQG